MAEVLIPRIREDKHEHVEAEIGFITELVILYLDMYIRRYGGSETKFKSFKIGRGGDVSALHIYPSEILTLKSGYPIISWHLLCHRTGSSSALISGRLSVEHSQISGRFEVLELKPEAVTIWVGERDSRKRK